MQPPPPIPVGRGSVGGGSRGARTLPWSYLIWTYKGKCVMRDFLRSPKQHSWYHSPLLQAFWAYIINLFVFIFFVLVCMSFLLLYNICLYSSCFVDKMFSFQLEQPILDCHQLSYCVLMNWFSFPKVCGSHIGCLECVSLWEPISILVSYIF